MTQNTFAERHIGPRHNDLAKMLKAIGVASLDELIDKTVPSDIRLPEALKLPAAVSEFEYRKEIRKTANKNKLYRTFIGQGYYGTVLPSVIQRNVFENPDWYTSYTPYQAEISQGRLTALLNFQTMVTELTGMEIANASLLDEATAAAEAMIMLYNTRSNAGKNVFVADKNIFIQTLDVLKTRALPLGIELISLDLQNEPLPDNAYAILLQYPTADGCILRYENLTQLAHNKDIKVAVAADLLSLSLLTPPGQWGADVVLGSSQRFGIPMGYGGPHAAFFATRESFKRNMPGRIIGVSKDANGRLALRMALQTREQHIKRERATSNICTAQALLAIMAGMYGVYHGADGLKNIALHIHACANILATGLTKMGYKITHQNFFDTLSIELPNDLKSHEIELIALEHKLNFWYPDVKKVIISFDETTTVVDLNHILEVFGIAVIHKFDRVKTIPSNISIAAELLRKDEFMQQETFNRYRSETEMMRYIKMLENKDISLTRSMISLGSCTMKLNAATEMMALTWPEFANMHPFVPISQSEGYHQIFHELGKYLKEITGMSGISFMPNSGAAGEYAGLMVIRQYHLAQGNTQRNVALIPSSAHGTNPASAAMAGMKIVVVDCDEKGNISSEDLEAKAQQYASTLAAAMITYPSTHGVYEGKIRKLVDIVHRFGGQVYMDGANMNAQVGLTSPGYIGADVCHLNLHKTFAIPHGGGGPGVGPICVAEHLIEYLPTHPIYPTGGQNGVTAVSAAPYGSANILLISHAYCRMLGSEGLTNATKYAILNANYIASALKPQFSTLYTGENDTVAHEMIIDCRSFKTLANISEADIAKRLMDFGYHAPTLSFPVHGTLMIEPTESESLAELDKFISALKTIFAEISEIAEGKADRNDNVLKNAPHAEQDIVSDDWNHSYSRTKAAYPLNWVRENKYWPPVSRIDDAFGDRNLVCTCLPVENYRAENY
jgi:glycine dehydrogenase